MGARKRIAVIACDMIDEFHSDVIGGIRAAAGSLDMDVLVFTTFIVGLHASQYQTGETNIYSLIDFSEFEGVIFYEDSFKKPIIIDEIFELLEKKCKVPVAVIGNGRGIYESFRFIGRTAIEELTEHFICEHGFTKIYCLTGFKGHVVAEERLSGYLDAMKKHGLSVPDSYIYYGDFWQDVAYELADKIADGKIEKPEAVICANDCMAIFLSSRLISRGFDVPGDISVCGFDNIPESGRNVPAITTYHPPEYDIGAKSTLFIAGKARGEDLISGYTDRNGYIVKRVSCGCKPDEKLVQQQYAENLEQHRFTDLFLNSFMEETIYTAENIEKMSESLINFTYLIDGIYRYHLCLCDNWNVGEPDAGFPVHGYSKNRIVCMTKYENEKADVIAAITDKTVPSIDEERDFPTVYFLTPLHFNDHCFGYSVLSFGKNDRVYNSIYRLWNKCVDNALELIIARSKLYLSSIHDALTGLYNRRGFDEASQRMFSDALKNEKKVFVVGADLDLLKFINDNYGHIEGDNAIQIAAQALRSSCSATEICARTGGDEYNVMGVGEYGAEYFDTFKNRVQKYLDEYNASSGKPYQIGISMGGYIGAPDAEISLERLITSADNEMYRDKCIRKGGRRRDDHR